MPPEPDEGESDEGEDAERPPPAAEERPTDEDDERPADEDDERPTDEDDERPTDEDDERPTDEDEKRGADADEEPADSPVDYGPITYEEPGAAVAADEETDADGTVTDHEGSDTDGPDDDASGADLGLEDVERVVVDPDDVVEGMRYNADPAPKIEGNTIFSLGPPYRRTERLEPESLDVDSDPDLEEVHQRSPIDPGDRIHVRPFRFVEAGSAVLKQYPSRELAREQLGDDADDEEIAAWRAAAMQRWEAFIRENLADQLELYSREGITFLDVEYDA